MNIDLIAANAQYHLLFLSLVYRKAEKAETSDAILNERKKEPLKEVIQLIEENRVKKISPISMGKITFVYNDRLKALGYTEMECHTTRLRKNIVDVP